MGYGTFRIEVKNDSIWATFPRERALLKPTHYDIFKPFLVKYNKVNKEEIGFSFNFQTNDLGDIESVKLKLEPTMDAIVFKRSPEEVPVSKDTLNKFAGVYVLSGAEINVSVKNGILMLLVPGQPEYSLIPIKENEFAIKGLSGYKTEFQEKNGVLNLIFHQPNGTFTATKK